MAFFDQRKGGTMPDIDRAEKLIITLGQRISEQNELLRMISVSLRGVEAAASGYALLARFTGFSFKDNSYSNSWTSGSNEQVVLRLNF
jgi:hypothetical protein